MTTFHPKEQKSSHVATIRVLKEISNWHIIKVTGPAKTKEK
jgi:hypothetical protein